MTDLLTGPPQADDRSYTGSAISRGQLARRIQRVLAQLLEADRWPTPSTLGASLVPLTGAVLKEHRLTKPDRAAGIKVAGGAATYCWEFLPEPTWSWQPRLAAIPDGAAPALVWAGPDGQLLGDILLANLQRTPAETGIPLAAELARQVAAMGAELTAVRLLTLAAPAQALLLTPVRGARTPDEFDGTSSFTATALDDSPSAGIGGLGR